jgi:hypothetical protein
MSLIDRAAPARGATKITAFPFAPGMEFLIRATADCTVTGTFANGKVATAYDVDKGYNPIAFLRIDSVSTGTIWALDV